MKTGIGHIYEFAGFRIDEAERLLLRDNQPVAVTPRAFDLLLYLVKNKNRLVEKDELLEKVWGGSFVEEANINVNISTLRKALGQNSSPNKFIETVSKKGYRFIADVREINAEPDIIIANYTKTRIVKEEEETTENESQVLPERRTRNNRNLIFALLVGSIAVLLVGGFFYFGPTNSSIQNEPNAEAFDLYQRGREAMERRNAEDIKRSIRFFELAIEKDPNFALGHAGLSDAYSYLGDYDVLPPDEIHRKSKAEARRAVELDDTLGKSHLSLGNMLRDEWDFAESEKEVKRAIELEPDNAEAHHIYSKRSKRLSKNTLHLITLLCFMRVSAKKTKRLNISKKPTTNARRCLLQFVATTNSTIRAPMRDSRIYSGESDSKNINPI